MKIAEDTSRLHQDQIADEKRGALPIEQLQHSQELRFVILREIANEHIGIERDHDCARL
jgi:hypothetical protein